MIQTLKRITSVVLISAMLLVTVGSNVGCYTHRYDVGRGGNEGKSQEFVRWYAVWGLVPISETQGAVKSYTQGDADYTITTQITGIDWLISIFTGIVSITRSTAIIER